MEEPNTLKRFKQRIDETSKQKTKKEKRQNKINKLMSSDKHWKGLEQVDHSHLTEDISGLNRAFMKFRGLYQSGRKFSCKEWIDLMADLLDEVD